jgi:hypothetical protein
MFKRRLIGRRNSAGATPTSLSLLKGPSSSELHSSSGVDSLSSAAGGAGGGGGGGSRASNSSTASPTTCLKKSPSSKSNGSSPTVVATGNSGSSPPQHRRNGKSRHVRFRTVYIREYERIIGDNPSCSSGAPIRFVSFCKDNSIAWNLFAI